MEAYIDSLYRALELENRDLHEKYISIPALTQEYVRQVYRTMYFLNTQNKELLFEDQNQEAEQDRLLRIFTSEP